MSSPSTRPPNPGDGAVSSLWLGVRFLIIAPLLPAGSDEGGVAAVFRCPGVRATTMQEGNDREHDGQYSQGHGFGGDDAPARRAHGEIVLTPVRGVKAAMNVPTMPRQVCPGTLRAGVTVAAKQTHAMCSMNALPHAWSRVPGQGCANGGFVLVSRSMNGGLR
jgi:hypothetical protein